MSSQQLMDPLGDAHSQSAVNPAEPPPEVFAEMARANIRYAELEWGGLHVAFHEGEPGAPAQIQLETVDGTPLGELAPADAIAMACDEDAPEAG
jgi:hypothetical protein